MVDVPPATSSNPEVAAAVAGAFPKTSEAGTAQSVISLFQQAAESVGTGNTSQVMFALIEANATGKTPTDLLAGFTEDQRSAFDRALRQLNMGQGASVMAQDILNSKVQINGTVTSFEAAVEQLISSYAGSGGPTSPQNQAEFQQKYKELVEQAKSEIDKVGSNHTSTQDQLITGVQKGSTPQIPTTMTPTSSDPTKASVPGMPDGALGSVLQNVAGTMTKPPNIPMPNVSQLAQPVAQSAQSAIQKLMEGAGKGSGTGVPITDDALKKLTTTAGLNTQGASLSNPRGPGGPGGENETGAGGPGARTAGLGGAGGDREGGGRNTTGQSTQQADYEGDKDQDGQQRGPDGKPLPPHPGASGPAAPGSPGTPGAPADGAPHPSSTSPTTPATTAAPASGAPSTTLSAGGGGVGPDSLSGPSTSATHTSAGDAPGAGAATLAPTQAGAAPAAPAAGTPAGAAPMGGGMMPMMPMAPMMGGAGAGSGAGGSNSTESKEDRAKRPGFRPDLSTADSALVDFGADLKGLDHATDMQHIAAAIAAGIVRAHRRVGAATKVAVGISGSQAVLVTSDGLGFLSPGVKAPANLTPLITLVPDSFVSRWLGCDQPWRPLLEAADLGLVAPFDSVVSTDLSAGQQGVLVLDTEDIEAVNAIPGTLPREHVDAVDLEDVDEVLGYLTGIWGRPTQPAAELETEVWTSRWMGDTGPREYTPVWVRYLLSAAAVDLQTGDIDSARYMLRSALRVPVSAEVAR